MEFTLAKSSVFDIRSDDQPPSIVPLVKLELLALDLDGLGNWRSIPEGAMWSNLIVLLPPVPDQYLRLQQLCGQSPESGGKRRSGISYPNEGKRNQTEGRIYRCEEDTTKDRG